MLTFTIIQSNLHWENTAANLTMFAEKIAAIHQPTQVVVLPEMFSTGFSMQPQLFAETMEGSTIQWMQQQAQQHNIILCGSVMINDDNYFYNRFIWMQPNGQVHYYNKRHLFAYAGEDKHYTAGIEKKIVQANGIKILPLVCYDLRFPVWSRQTKEPYDVLIYTANWPERRSAAWQSLLVARAIENQCYVIGVNRVGNDGNGIYHSGNSMVVNPMGEILFQNAHDEITHTFTIDKNEIDEVRTKLPFLNDKDNFNIVP